jgi:hypothetical protein
VAARERAVVAVPRLPEERRREVQRQLVEAGIDARHELAEGDGGPGVELLESVGIELSSMGRSLQESPELFLAGAAAGAVAAAYL